MEEYKLHQFWKTRVQYNDFVLDVSNINKKVFDRSSPVILQISKETKINIHHENKTELEKHIKFRNTAKLI